MMANFCPVAQTQGVYGLFNLTIYHVIKEKLPFEVSLCPDCTTWRLSVIVGLKPHLPLYIYIYIHMMWPTNNYVLNNNNIIVRYFIFHFQTSCGPGWLVFLSSHRECWKCSKKKTEKERKMKLAPLCVVQTVYKKKIIKMWICSGGKTERASLRLT